MDNNTAYHNTDHENRIRVLERSNSELWAAVFGNGNKSMSIVERLLRVENKDKFWDAVMKALIVLAGLATIVGNLV